jgi:tetratricopeptide (TPR) repeat protein
MLEALMGRAHARLNLGAQKLRTAPLEAAALCEAALQDYEKAAAARPRSLSQVAEGRGIAYMNLALLRLRAREDPEPFFREALRELDAAVAANPRSANAWHQRGQVSFRWAGYKKERGLKAAEEYRAALRDFQKAVACSPAIASRLESPIQICREQLQRENE